MEKMSFWMLAFWMLALPLLGVSQEKKKPAELVLLELHARRNVDMIHIDGRVKNVGGRAAQGVTMIIHFMAPGGATISTLKGPLEVADVEPGEEAQFLLEAPDPPRSVRVKVELEDSGGRVVKLSKPGPYAID